MLSMNLHTICLADFLAPTSANLFVGGANSSPDSLLDDGTLKLDVVAISQLRYTYKKFPLLERCRGFCIGLEKHVNEANGISTPATDPTKTHLTKVNGKGKCKGDTMDKNEASLVDIATLNRVVEVLRQRQWPLGAKSLADHLEECLVVVASNVLSDSNAQTNTVLSRKNEQKQEKEREEGGDETRLADELDLVNDELIKLREENIRLQAHLAGSNRETSHKEAAEVESLKSALQGQRIETNECQARLELSERRAQITLKGRDDELMVRDKMVATLRESLANSESRVAQLRGQLVELEAAIAGAKS